MPTIREVAKRARVSPATVSRVINGTAKVNGPTRERVLKAIEETGFQPNELARALYKQSSHLIGLIVPDIVNPFFAELAKAIEEAAHESGYRILLCNSNNDARKEEQNIDLLTRMKADGIILITNNNRTGELIRNCRMPVVVVDRHIRGAGELAHIESDHYTGGRLATQCLFDNGCKNIVCMRGPQSFTSGRLRYKGYADVCKEHGRRPKYVDTEYNFASGEKAAVDMLEKYPDLDGVVAANDMVALSTFKVLKRNGRRVPEDVSIVGFDDIEFSKLVTPSLSTIRQPIREMGTRAIEIILGSVRGEACEKDNVFDVTLVERETTKKRLKKKK